MLHLNGYLSLNTTKHILSDVVISHPLCPTHYRAAARGHTEVAEQAATRKHDKYNQVAHDHDARLIAFSVETMGGMSEEAEELVEQISLACTDHLVLRTHAHIARGVRASVAVQVQKGNALAVLAGYSRAVQRG